jgi:hypothetical protein
MSLLLARNGHRDSAEDRLLSRVERTSRFDRVMSVVDPKRTFSPREQLFLLRLAYGRGTHATPHVAGREVPRLSHVRFGPIGDIRLNRVTRRRAPSPLNVRF